MILVTFYGFLSHFRGDLMNPKAGILKRTVVACFAAVILLGQVCFAKYSGGSGTSGDPFEKDFDIIVKLKGSAA